MYRHFSPEDFSRIDESNDDNFYAEPRMVVHIDDVAIAHVTDIIRRRVPENARVLDLMSSYRSHLPPEAHYQEVVGLGMNAAEMQANPQLTDFLVHNLNTDPTLPFADRSFDAVLNTVSIQYLTQPVAVFREVARVLRPDGISIVFFSDRMFPTKAVEIWQDGDNEAHIRLVSSYYALAGEYSRVEVEAHEDTRAPGFVRGHDPLFALIGTRAENDE
jgi:SAM-dependent methyltransferase